MKEKKKNFYADQCKTASSDGPGNDPTNVSRPKRQPRQKFARGTREQRNERFGKEVG